MTGSLHDIVNVLACCIFTWKIFTTMIPAFLLAGAVGAFVPGTLVLRYLGTGARKRTAYLAAALSGMVLSLCSCNVVPLFVSIYRRGAGIGPAFTFLFASPALGLLSLIFTFKVIGTGAGLWRVVFVPVIAIVTGSLMALIFRRHEVTRQAELAAARVETASEETNWRIWPLFGLLLGMVVYGAWEMPWAPKLIGLGALLAAMAIYFLRLFDREDFRDWMWETWGLLKLIIPILAPALLLIALISSRISLVWVNHWLYTPTGDFWGMLRTTFGAAVFGALMYFPVLTEIAFVKAFLLSGMSIGPGMALLFTGPGLSLPGAIIVARAVGWRRVLVYQAIVIVLATAVALLFVSEVGQYICACTQLQQ